MRGHSTVPPTLAQQVKLAILRGPPQLTARAPSKLIRQQLRIAIPQRIAQTHPREVKNLMDQDTGQLRRLRDQSTVQDDDAFWYVCGRVNRLTFRLAGVKFASICNQSRTEPDRYRAAL